MSGIAWPAAAVILGFGFMLLFRSSISALTSPLRAGRCRAGGHINLSIRSPMHHPGDGISTVCQDDCRNAPASGWRNPAGGISAAQAQRRVQGHLGVSHRR
jgi:hypothetical protein